MTRRIVLACLLAAVVFVPNATPIAARPLCQLIGGHCQDVTGYCGSSGRECRLSLDGSSCACVPFIDPIDPWRAARPCVAP